jgi:hypothetical protein
LKSLCINSRPVTWPKSIASSVLLAVVLLPSLAFGVDVAAGFGPCDGDPMNDGRMVYASMKGGEKTYQDRTVTTVPLSTAVADACSGDVIQLVRDDYRLHGNSITVRRRAQESQQKPIIIRGLGAQTTIRGGTAPGHRLSPKSMRPGENEHSCLRLEDQSWIVIENLDFADCWPIAILSIDSRYITLRDSRIVGSTFGFYGLGTWRESAGRCDGNDQGFSAHHYLMENVQWIQDPPDGPLPARGASVGSGEMWRRYRWIDVHDRDRPYHYFNGALFGSWNILGGVVFLRNHFLKAFNVLRLDAPRREVAGQRNLNIEIYDNRFEFVRDNTIEPEHEVTNLWVHRNRSANTYAALSTDGVGGNYWYVFGNAHWFNEAPSRECRLDPSCRQCLDDPLCAREHMHRRGKTVKLGTGPFPGEAFYIFHNSAFQRHPSAAEGETRNLHVWNNVIQICKPADDPAGRCEPSRAFEGLCYRPSYDFRSNVTNDPGCMAPCGQPGAEPICVYKDVYDPTITPMFNDPIRGDLRLSPASPARGAASALALKLPDDTLWSNQVGDSLTSPDAGAYDGDELLAGPPFVLFDPEDRRLVAAYAERPRIVSVSREEQPQYWIQRFDFSVPIYFDRPGKALILRVKADDTSSDPLAASEPCAIEGRALRCRFAKSRSFPAAERALIFLPRGIKSKRRGDLGETAGLELTLWASVDRRVCLEPDQCPNLRSPSLR